MSIGVIYVLRHSSPIKGDIPYVLMYLAARV
jgi:hypothetical protein